MAAARGQKTLATLVKSLRSGPISNSSAPRLRHLPSLRRTFSLYDQINLIDSVPEDQLRFQSNGAAQGCGGTTPPCCYNVGSTIVEGTASTCCARYRSRGVG